MLRRVGVERGSELPIEIEAIQTAANIIGAAMQHQRVAEALLASEQKYRLLFENEYDAVMVFDASENDVTGDFDGG